LSTPADSTNCRSPVSQRVAQRGFSVGQGSIKWSTESLITFEHAVCAWWFQTGLDQRITAHAPAHRQPGCWKHRTICMARQRDVRTKGPGFGGQAKTSQGLTQRSLKMQQPRRYRIGLQHCHAVGPHLKATQAEVEAVHCHLQPHHQFRQSAPRHLTDEMQRQVQSFGCDRRCRRCPSPSITPRQQRIAHDWPGP